MRGWIFGNTCEGCLPVVAGGYVPADAFYGVLSHGLRHVGWPLRSR